MVPYQLVSLTLICYLLGATNGHEYDVVARDGKICMKMQMDTEMRHPFYSSLSTWMPANVTILSQYDECPSNVSIFEAQWRDQGYLWRFALRFENVKDKYSLERFYGVVDDEDGSEPRDWSFWEPTYPGAAIGKYVTCEILITARTRFHDYKWQPYVQGAGGSFGSETECELGLSGGLVFCVILVLIFGIVSMFLLLIITSVGH